MKYLFFLLFTHFFLETSSQERIPLYPHGIPNSKNVKNKEQDFPDKTVDTITRYISEPSLTVFLPLKEKRNGTAVIICPGGGYHLLLTKREGTEIAKAFNALGVTAFVLRYRLPDDVVLINKSIGPLQDAQMGMKIVRERAIEWGIDTARVGIMGFSAGGHLAATLAVHFDDHLIFNARNTSLRPDFTVLINPIISMQDDITHTESRRNLLGLLPEPEKKVFFSPQLQVNESTPPTFLVHSNADEIVSVDNSIVFYTALRQYQIASEMHLYAHGEHGFLTAPSFEEWFGRCVEWMKRNRLCNPIE